MTTTSACSDNPQVRLNQIALNVREAGVPTEVSQQRRLLHPGVLHQSSRERLCRQLAGGAADNYIALQKLKAAERAAAEADEVSLGGQIWDLVGWDRLPTDFLWDVRGSPS